MRSFVLCCTLLLLAPPLAAQEAARLTVLGRIEPSVGSLGPSGASEPAVAVASPHPRDRGIEIDALAPHADFDAGNTAKVVGAGILGGAIGLFGGALLGAAIAHDETCAECLEELRGALIGGTIGEGLLLPLGVHLASGRTGSYLPSALTSVSLAAAGAAFMEAAHWDPPAVPIIAVAVPLAQLITSALIMGATSS